MANLYKCERLNSTENRGNKKTPPPKKKLCFKTCKKNTINSLNEVEHFLRNFKNFTRYIKLYKIL